MSVLNKLTKKEKKTLNKCLNDRVFQFVNDYNKPSEKVVSLGFYETGRNSNFTRIKAAFMYFISKEKIRNENDFRIGVSCITQTINAGDEVGILFYLFSHKKFSYPTFTLQNLLPQTIDKRFVLHLKFEGGYFEEDEPKKKKKNNGEEIFKEEKCVICLDKEPNIYFVNCGHICLCDNVMIKKDAIDNCPVCRTKSDVKRKLKN